MSTSLRDLGMRLQIVDPATGETLGDLSEQADQVVYTGLMPGGLGSLTFRVVRSVLLAYPDLAAGLDVLASDALGFFWRARLERQVGHIEQAGDYLTLNAVCPVADDLSVADVTTGAPPTWTSGTNLSAAYAAVAGYMTLLASTAPLPTLGGFSANYTLPLDQKPAAGMNLLTAFGDVGQNPLWWAIWPDGVFGAFNNGGYQLSVFSRPLSGSAPTYYSSLDFLQGTLGFDLAMYGNRQPIRYNGGASWYKVDNSAEIARLGFTREAKLITRNDVTALADAQAIATAALALRSQMRVRCETVTITHPLGIWDAAGDAVPLWRVRPGAILGLWGPQPLFAGTYTLDRNAATIVRTQYSVDNDALTLTFESMDQTLEGRLAKAA